MIKMATCSTAGSPGTKSVRNRSEHGSAREIATEGSP
ncbi:hypothetical protein GZL_00744 [Streptomyces sp. 769]|nr:hypothetical protein GZL_00744 [Streptomyces sp. 769]